MVSLTSNVTVLMKLHKSLGPEYLLIQNKEEKIA